MSSKGRQKTQEYIVEDKSAVGKTKVAKMTRKQKGFCDEYIANWWNGTKAALKTYNTTDYNTAHSIATENLQKPAIKAFLQQEAELAKSAIMDIIENAKSEGNKLNAAKFVIEQVHWKATNNTQINSGGGNITINTASFLS